MGIRRAAALAALGLVTAGVGVRLLGQAPAEGGIIVALGLVSAALGGEWVARKRRHSGAGPVDDGGIVRPDSFETVLAERVEAASRHLRPLTLAILELHEPDWSPPSAFAAEVAMLRGRLLRSGDIVARHGEHRLALVLDEADEEAGRDAVERLRGALTESRHRSRLFAGVASYPRHALDPVRLLERATTALVTARDDGGPHTASPADVFD
ncbi:MAG: diguanylate cyclase [Actinomycetota bacterium]